MRTLIDIKTIQQRIYQNKVDHQFNTSNVHDEFINIFKELTEAIEAYDNQLPSIGEELADIIIFTIGIASILDIDIEDELLQKLDINEQRIYVRDKGRYLKQ